MASAGSAEKQFDRRERANGSRKKRAFKSNIFSLRSRLFQRYVVESIFLKNRYVWVTTGKMTPSRLGVDLVSFSPLAARDGRLGSCAHVARDTKWQSADVRCA
jgi:hypothetical protein